MKDGNAFAHDFISLAGNLFNQSLFLFLYLPAQDNLMMILDEARAFVATIDLVIF